MTDLEVFDSLLSQCRAGQNYHILIGFQGFISLIIILILILLKCLNNNMQFASCRTSQACRLWWILRPCETLYKLLAVNQRTSIHSVPRIWSLTTVCRSGNILSLPSSFSLSLSLSLPLPLFLSLSLSLSIYLSHPSINTILLNIT